MKKYLFQFLAGTEMDLNSSPSVLSPYCLAPFISAPPSSSPSTISKWYSCVEGKPGFQAPAFEFLKEKNYNGGINC
jgi:hypothetical protein